MHGRLVAHRVSMKKESVIIVVIVAFVAGFIAGAIGGIEFYSKEHRNAALGLGPQEENAPRGASEDGIGQLEALVRREPQNLQALISLGNLYFDSHQPQKAIGAYERALAIDPKNPDVRTTWALCIGRQRTMTARCKSFAKRRASTGITRTADSIWPLCSRRTRTISEERLPPGRTT